MGNRTDEEIPSPGVSLEHILQGCVLEFTTHFLSKRLPSSTPHTGIGGSSLQLPLAGETKREGWSLEPAQLWQKVMIYLGQHVPLPQVNREQGWFLGSAMWPG